MFFMVKANGYGHGLLEVADFSFRELGIKAFGVASIGEALHLRRKGGNYCGEVYVFSDLALSRHWEDYLNFKLLPVVSHQDDLQLLLGESRCRHLPLVLLFLIRG